ncbi:amidophosphoribosyltransferase [Capsulimonas corticalis]|uniref:Amidophosphoribosyltransferase n=2 Tax=Capsulimonas corticalis TaxID=2219043 RepID=A0A402CTB5_9BACT|nr:amidophosphoribosyltransferase [Capsulimonas corticalis]
METMKFDDDALMLATAAARDEDDTPKEECGVFGIYAPDVDVARLTYFGLFALQHRGQESAGMMVSDGEHLKWYKEMGLVNQIFDERVLSQLQGYIAIGHTRYSTTGSSILRNAQPLHCAWGDGSVAVAHNGNLINTEELRAEMEAQGVVFETTNDSEVIARMIATQQDKTLEDAIAHTMTRLRGAYSVCILTEDTLIAIRDPHGVRPLCLGLLDNKHYVVASETCALNTIGAQYVREIEPGEMIIIDKHGFRERQAVKQERHATCLLEFIYFARPDSTMYGRGLHDARRRMGHELAKEHPCPGAHMVMPIPDGATPAAIGFAEASGIPYGEGVVKNRYIGRTFIQPDQRMREAGVRMKLMPIKEALAGKRVVMVDDSIVRGTTTGQIVKRLFDAGASEVHVRITAPPVQFPCFYGIDMANQEDLVAYRHTVEEIRQLIGATSLGFMSLDGLTRAIGIHKDKFCRACFDGKYPIEIPNHVKVSKFALEMPVNAK